MHVLIRAAMLLAAGAAGWALAKRGKHNPTETEDTSRVVYLDDDAQVRPDAGQMPAPAQVLHCYRRMDPLTLTGMSDVTFRLAEGTEIRLNVSGEGGLHLREGETGLLTWQGSRLILFEKDNGETVSDMYYAPAEEDADE